MWQILSDKNDAGDGEAPDGGAKREGEGGTSPVLQARPPSWTGQASAGQGPPWLKKLVHRLSKNQRAGAP